MEFEGKDRDKSMLGRGSEKGLQESPVPTFATVPI